MKQLHSYCNRLIPTAIGVMEIEYVKPDRVKLTHYWLAQRLGIPDYVAFLLLQKVASKKALCVQTPAGPIFWDNELMKVGELIRLFDIQLK